MTPRQSSKIATVGAGLFLAFLTACEPPTRSEPFSAYGDWISQQSFDQHLRLGESDQLVLQIGSTSGELNGTASIGSVTLAITGGRWSGGSLGSGPSVSLEVEGGVELRLEPRGAEEMDGWIDGIIRDAEGPRYIFRLEYVRFLRPRG